MTLSKARVEYERLLFIDATPEELAAGLKELMEGKNKMNITYYPLCDNDNGDDPWP